MPEGDYRIQDRKVTPPPRARIDESMEALIHHFKIFTEGFKVPAGEVYVAIESPRGECSCGSYAGRLPSRRTAATLRARATRRSSCRPRRGPCRWSRGRADARPCG